MNVRDILAFVPSQDYETSILFYTEIGFESEYVSEDLTLFKNGDCEFFLQRFYNEQLAKNFMLQIRVSSIQQAYDLCIKSKHKTKISAISHESWGHVFYVWGPAGELLHITAV
ncbi:hypothetical protein PALB_26020 [Pseudoalteromonas luteoviolacea B = ATCC 29581]|nr:hypothetical protein PALB_26020 [Pseudoalteromonas luteoviolacea B = ATCC 29581]